jgi:chromosome segregation ATPase
LRKEFENKKSELNSLYADMDGVYSSNDQCITAQK